MDNNRLIKLGNMYLEDIGSKLSDEIINIFEENGYTIAEAPGSTELVIMKTLEDLAHDNIK